jgi:4-diphosphocytidyl-2-C-methyl-D-erythritol kinase
VPYCLISKPSIVSSVGEVVNEVAIPDLNILLINPNKILSTVEVFTFSPIDLQKTGVKIDNSNFIESLIICKNSLETNAIKLLPVIKEILDLLGEQRGCLLSRMTGSGSSCFALFNTKEDLKEAMRNISCLKPEWLTIDVSY